VTGPGATVAPDQKTLSRLPAPHVSAVFPVQVMLQSERLVFVLVPAKELPHPEAEVSRRRHAIRSNTYSTPGHIRPEHSLA
jgi:hypothetical protein